MRRGMRLGREILLLAVLYAGYSIARHAASDEFAPARDRAAEILRLETHLGLDVEGSLNHLLNLSHGLSLAASFWYASAHYIVTTAVVVWLMLRRPKHYAPLRTTLVLATAAALVLYLLVPTAPPRLVGGFTDILAATSADGWWGAEASAPKGLGGTTNQLAAFPSMHAGWAVWVAVVAVRVGARRRWQIAAQLYALTTVLVIVATANHWVLDAVVGAAMIVGADVLVYRARDARSRARAVASVSPVAETAGVAARRTLEP